MSEKNHDDQHHHHDYYKKDCHRGWKVLFYGARGCLAVKESAERRQAHAAELLDTAVLPAWSSLCDWKTLPARRLKDSSPPRGSPRGDSDSDSDSDSSSCSDGDSDDDCWYTRPKKERRWQKI